MAAHEQKRLRVVVGVEQCDLAADQLGVLARPALLAQVGHLPVDLDQRVRAVDPHPVGLARVVARGAGEVAAREHAVRPLAPGGPPPEALPVVLDVVGQLVPPPPQRGLGVGVDRAGGEVEPAQAFVKAGQAVAQSQPGRDRVTVLRCEGA